MCYKRLMSESEQNPVGQSAATPIRFATQSVCFGALLNGGTNPNGAGLFGEDLPLRLLT
jgi:hypothetical protein